jgi:hypothetical protein
MAVQALKKAAYIYEMYTFDAFYHFINRKNMPLKNIVNQQQTYLL